MSRTLVYLLGYCTLILGLALAARLLGIPDPWLIAGVVTLLGSGIMAASSRLK